MPHPRFQSAKTINFECRTGNSKRPNHKFQNGDEVRIVSVASTINATKNANLTSAFDLSTFDKLFCTRVNADYIGLATERTGIGTVGISTDSENVYFKEILRGTNNEDDHKIELVTNNIWIFRPLEPALKIEYPVFIWKVDYRTGC